MSNETKQSKQKSSDGQSRDTKQKQASFLDFQLPNPLDGLTSVLGLKGIFDGPKEPDKTSEVVKPTEGNSDATRNTRSETSPINVNVNLGKYFKPKLKRKSDGNGSATVTETKGTKAGNEVRTEDTEGNAA